MRTVFMRLTEEQWGVGYVNIALAPSMPEIIVHVEQSTEPLPTREIKWPLPLNAWYEITVIEGIEIYFIRGAGVHTSDDVLEEDGLQSET